MAGPETAGVAVSVERAWSTSDSRRPQTSRADRSRIRLLDAAYEQFAESGIARSSMEEVARRAGMARITIYRKFDTKESLVDAVIQREFERYFAEYAAVVAGLPSAAERAIAAFVSSLRTLWGNPLIRRLLDTEPELAVSVVGGDGGSTFESVRAFVAAQIGGEQAAGNLSSEVDADLAAELLVRISGSLLTSPSRLVDLGDEAQLERLAREFLLPMLRL